MPAYLRGSEVHGQVLGGVAAAARECHGELQELLRGVAAHVVNHLQAKFETRRSLHRLSRVETRNRFIGWRG
jgi:hypothetical protein